MISSTTYVERILNRVYVLMDANAPTGRKVDREESLEGVGVCMWA